jgi:phenylacetate-CoA ligase
VLVETRDASLDANELAGRAEHLIKAYVGVTTKVRVVAPGTIERSQGKAKRVNDLRPKQ